MKNVKLDKFYQSVLDNYSKDFLEISGYFQELNLPLVKVSEKLNMEEGVILLTTGSFAPMHNGHKHMMDKARNYCEKSGIKIAASIFSFSHDGYVLTKDNNIPNKKIRIEQSKNVLKNSEHQVSIWEIEQLKPVNFTTVIEYFEKKYNRPVIYVFGKDNYNFSYAFNSYGKGIYIPTEDIPLDKLEPIKKIKNVKILEISQYNLNSRDIRKKKYVVRDDSLYFTEKFNEEKIKEFKIRFYELLYTMTNYSVLELRAEDYLSIKPKYNTISLDVYYKGDYNLEISREFKLFFQEKAEKITNRIGSIELEKQLELIKKGDYTLVDDDIASGFTVKTITKALKEKGIEIKEIIALNPVKEKDMYDIVDLRDFIIGAKNGGLQIKNDGSILKIPYISPYVDLLSRAKILFPKEFSIELLKLNLFLYKNSLEKIKESYHKDFFLLAGFNENELIETAILSLIERLK